MQGEIGSPISEIARIRLKVSVALSFANARII
jgi:hypothetical protein